MAIEPFVMSRVFDAPRDLLWQCFTDPEHMKQWWGPKGAKVIHAKMDLRVGGTYHYCLEFNGTPMWGRFVYRKVTPKDRFVVVSSFSDEQGGITRHPMAPTWPREMLSTFAFEDMPGGKTKFTITWQPHNATEEELQAFEAGRQSMTMGWTGTLDQLAAYLAAAK